MIKTVSTLIIKTLTPDFCLEGHFGPVCTVSIQTWCPCPWCSQGPGASRETVLQERSVSERNLEPVTVPCTGLGHKPQSHFISLSLFSPILSPSEIFVLFKETHNFYFSRIESLTTWWCFVKTDAVKTVSFCIFRQAFVHDLKVTHRAHVPSAFTFLSIKTISRICLLSTITISC